MDILKKIPNIYKNEQSIEFRAEISPFGKDLFYKENYPSMRINVDGEKIFIEGFYNKGEEKFIADYFLKYEKNLISVEPIELKKLITDRGREIFEYFYKL